MRTTWFWTWLRRSTEVSEKISPTVLPALNADLYQVLAYCTVLGLKVGRLIYAKGNGDRGFILGATTPAK